MRFSTVPQASPKPKAIAKGWKIAASPAGKKIKDERPISVVIEVRKIGRKRFVACVKSSSMFVTFCK